MPRITYGDDDQNKSVPHNSYSLIVQRKLTGRSGVSIFQPNNLKWIPDVESTSQAVAIDTYTGHCSDTEKLEGIGKLHYMSTFC